MSARFLSRVLLEWGEGNPAAGMGGGEQGARLARRLGAGALGPCGKNWGGAGRASHLPRAQEPSAAEPQ